MCVVREKMRRAEVFCPCEFSLGVVVGYYYYYYDFV